MATRTTRSTSKGKGKSTTPTSTTVPDRTTISHAMSRKYSQSQSLPGRNQPQPMFEMVVLGSGGGPLETDTSGYLLKPYHDSWEDGILALEGGSGLGALATLFEYRDPAELFPTLNFPDTHNSPVLRAAYVFSFLSCYLITHAHLDHCISLILLSGSIPPRPTLPLPSRVFQPLSPPPTSKSLTSTIPAIPAAPLTRPPVYATRYTLDRLAMAYGGELWPELGAWAPERVHSHEHSHTVVGQTAGSSTPDGKRRKLDGARRGSLVEQGEDQMGSSKGTGVMFTPIIPDKNHRPLHPTLPFTTLKFHVAHGCTSKGAYESSAMFIRYDPTAVSTSDSSRGVSASTTRSRSTAISTPPAEPVDSDDEAPLREFLFFGDLESDYRRKGEEEYDVPGKERARGYNKVIWEEAARSMDAKRLAGVFIECSYDSNRPAHLMFGHISPPGLHYELRKMAQSVKASDSEAPLKGLKVFVTHIKDDLVPHPTGRSARQRIMSELTALEGDGVEQHLGVEFVELKKGDRLLF